MTIIVILFLFGFCIINMKIINIIRSNMKSLAELNKLEESCPILFNVFFGSSSRKKTIWSLRKLLTSIIANN